MICKVRITWTDGRQETRYMEFYEMEGWRNSVGNEFVKSVEWI